MGRPLSVLLVAADGFTRQITANGLAMYGFEPIVTRTGSEGLQVLESEVRVDVLVVDADLGGEVTGLTLAKAGKLLRPKLDVIYTARQPFRIPDAVKVKGAPSIRTPYQPQQIVGIISELRHRVTDDEAGRRVA